MLEVRLEERLEEVRRLEVEVRRLDIGIGILAELRRLLSRVIALGSFSRIIDLGSMLLIFVESFGNLSVRRSRRVFRFFEGSL